MCKIKYFKSMKDLNLIQEIGGLKLKQVMKGLKLIQKLKILKLVDDDLKYQIILGD